MNYSGLLEKINRYARAGDSAYSHHRQVQIFAKAGTVCVYTRAGVTKRFHDRVHLENLFF